MVAVPVASPLAVCRTGDALHLAPPGVTPPRAGPVLHTTHRATDCKEDVLVVVACTENGEVEEEGPKPLDPKSTPRSKGPRPTNSSRSTPHVGAPFPSKPVMKSTTHKHDALELPVGPTFVPPLPGITPPIFAPGLPHDCTGCGVIPTTTGLATSIAAYASPVSLATNHRRPVATATTAPGTVPLPAFSVTRFLAFKTTLTK